MNSSSKIRSLHTGTLYPFMCCQLYEREKSKYCLSKRICQSFIVLAPKKHVSSLFFRLFLKRQNVSYFLGRKESRHFLWHFKQGWLIDRIPRIEVVTKLQLLVHIYFWCTMLYIFQIGNPKVGLFTFAWASKTKWAGRADSAWFCPTIN